MAKKKAEEIVDETVDQTTEVVAEETTTEIAPNEQGHHSRDLTETK